MALLTAFTWTDFTTNATAGTHTVTNSDLVKQVYVQIVRGGIGVDGGKLPGSGQRSWTCQAGDTVRAQPVGGSGTASVAFV
jgi:hypothetical protein